MSKVIISSSYSNLEKYLKDDTQKYYYIPIDYVPAGIEIFFELKGYEKADISMAMEGIDYRKEYIDFIGNLNARYNSIYWLANSISYKGTFVFDLYAQLYNYYCVVSFIKKYPGNYVIISSNFILNKCLKRYCEGNKFDCRLLDLQNKKNRLVHLRRYCLSNLCFLLDGWMRKVLVFAYLRKNFKIIIDNKKTYYVIKSWADSRSFQKDNLYVDLFFGRLPAYLKERNIDFIILVGILDGYKEVVKKIKNVKGESIIPQEHFVGYFDYIKVIFLNLINRPRIDKGLNFLELGIADLVKECLDKDYEYGEVNKNLLYYYYIKGFLKKVKVDKLVFTFENQSWERMIVSGIRKHSPSTKIIGYAHSSIRQSMLGYFCSPKEDDVIPLPDRVITIGLEPKLILATAGSYIKRIELEEGCALRYEYIFKRKPFNRNKNGSILAAFSIDIVSSLKLIRFLQHSLQDRAGAKIILRSHPFTPIEMIIKKYNITLDPNFQISEKKNFEEELKRTSLIIYTDTTSSIEAVMCGIPAIHVDFKEPVNSDPLFKVNSFKWSVFGKDELCNVIDYIYTMNDDEYLKRHSDAMDYLKRYFYPVEERYLKKFTAD